MKIYAGSRVFPIKKSLQDIYQYAMLDTHLSSLVDQRKSKTLGEKYGIFLNGNVDDTKTELFRLKGYYLVDQGIQKGSGEGSRTEECSQLGIQEYPTSGAICAMYACFQMGSSASISVTVEMKLFLSFSFLRRFKIFFLRSS